ALDLGRRVDALELIDELRRERSLTVLSAVHDLTLAGQFADRLLLLAGGRAVAAGPPGRALRAAPLRAPRPACGAPTCCGRTSVPGCGSCAATARWSCWPSGYSVDDVH